MNNLTETTENMKLTKRHEFLRNLALAAFALFIVVAYGKPSDYTIVTKVSSFGTSANHPLLRALEDGDVRKVTRLLKSGEYDVNEVICTGSDDSVIDNSSGLASIRLSQVQWVHSPAYAFYHPRCFLGYVGTPASYEEPKPRYFLHGTPLMIACRLGRVELVRTLLERGANPNLAMKVADFDDSNIFAKGYQYVSALSEVALIGENASGSGANADRTARRCLALLKEHGAVPSPRDGRGKTLLWAALNGRSAALLDFCIESGLDPNEPDYADKTIADYCAERAGCHFDPDARVWVNFLRRITPHLHTRNRDADFGDDEEEEED